MRRAGRWFGMRDLGRPGLAGRGVLAAGAAAALAVAMAACGPAAGSTATGAGASGSGSGSAGGTTVTMANGPGANANFPFPMFGQNFTDQSLDTIQFDTVADVDDFQYLLYRPLYWFGTGVNPYLNTQLSLAAPATYQGHQVTIDMKTNYKWSNGEDVDADDVVFWINMMKALGSNWAFFSPTGLPGDITNVHAPSKYVVTFDITSPKFSETWFSDNELSEISPLPMAWDRTAAGPSDCVTTMSDCLAVYKYLTQQAELAPSTFASSPLWSVVDGPWKLQSMNTQGNVTLVFNPKYSGPVGAHHITKLVQVPFISEQAEYNVLQDPTGTQPIDLGYLPNDDAPVPPAGATVGANPPALSNYRLTAYYPWELTYFPYNFDNPTAGPIFKQLYFRQAFQSLVDQEGVVSGPLHGYGEPTIGPVSDTPVTTYLSPELRKLGDQWTLNIGKAESLLRSHGWTVVPGGTDTCARAGTGPTDCGAGIAAGTPLSFSLIYTSGVDEMQSAVRELASNASLAGIQVSLTAEPFGNVVDTAFGGSTTASKWELADWGAWTFAPDYLPTGDTLFEPATSNEPGNDAGFYNSAENDKLIDATLDARTPKEFTQAMYTWEDYLADQLPVVYEPNTPQLLETIKGLNIGPQNSALSIMPEFWSYKQ